MMAASTQPAIPTLSAQDVLQADPSAAGGNLANQGQGSSYLSMLPAFLQYASQNGGGVSSDMAASAPYQWLLANNYIAGDTGGTSVGLGWKAAGVTGAPIAAGQTGTSAGYNPNTATNIGSGFQVNGGAGGNTMLQMTGNNPYGVSTLGSLDVKELQNPAQSPSSFGSNALGPTVNKNNLQSNQDAWSKYIVPLMQAGASAGFGGLGGFGQLTALQSGLLSGAGNAITGGSGSPLATLGSVAGSALGAGLMNGSGLSAVSPYLNAAMSAYKISQNPNNPGSYLSTLGQLAKLGMGSGS